MFQLSPGEINEIITSLFVMPLIAFMVFIVWKDLILPSKMSKFGAYVICFVLLTAPVAFTIKNVVILASSFRL